MKKLMLAIVLILCVLVLAGCQSKEAERFQVVTAPTQNTGIQLYATAAPASDGYNFDDGSYDPASEENGSDDEIIEIPLSATNAPVPATAAPTVNSAYAGATPVVIDPIDKPTATPVPALTFTFATYDLGKMHLTFEGPSGWIAEEMSSDTFVLTNPSAKVDYLATITIHTSAVTSNYTDSQLKSEVTQYLDTLRSDTYVSLERSSVDSRTLMGKTGRYANYTAKTADGVQVAGRVMVTCIDKTLYFVHFTYPAAYKSTYESTVCTRLRNTLKQVK